MGKYLKKFVTHSAYESYIGGGEAILPNVSICDDETNIVHYNPYVEIQPNDEIWYTTTDENVVTPYDSSVFGANIVSNTYVDGKGVIKFDGDVISIGNYAFYNCSSLSSVTIGNGVTGIGKGAFEYCKSLSAITIPDSVTSIGNYAFCECTSLSAITIGSSVTSIGNNAFEYCKSLSAITIPDSVTGIGKSAFSFCESLSAITIGSSVTSIGEWAFEYCKSLSAITIPDSVTGIGGEAFGGIFIQKDNFVNNSSLDEEENGYWGAIIYDYMTDDTLCIKNNVVVGVRDTERETYSIPNSVTGIGNWAFRDCSSLSAITIPDSVTSIGEGAFSFCTSLSAITIPDSVTGIGGEAFYECSSLTSISCLATTPPTGGHGMFLNTNDCPIYVPSESVDAYKTADGWSDYASRIQTIPE